VPPKFRFVVTIIDFFFLIVTLQAAPRGSNGGQARKPNIWARRAGCHVPNVVISLQPRPSESALALCSDRHSQGKYA
jgi:hypothetical protein